MSNTPRPSAPEPQQTPAPPYAIAALPSYRIASPPPPSRPLPPHTESQTARRPRNCSLPTSFGSASAATDSRHTKPYSTRSTPAPTSRFARSARQRIFPLPRRSLPVPAAASRPASLALQPRARARLPVGPPDNPALHPPTAPPQPPPPHTPIP